MLFMLSILLILFFVFIQNNDFLIYNPKNWTPIRTAVDRDTVRYYNFNITYEIK